MVAIIFLTAIACACLAVLVAILLSMRKQEIILESIEIAALKSGRSDVADPDEGKTVGHET